MRIILNGLFYYISKVSDVSSHQSRFDGKLIIASFAVLTYWLFAQSFINIGSSVQKTFGATDSTLNLSIGLVSFVTGIFMVGAGDIADKVGNLKMTIIGLVFSIIGCLSLIIVPVTPFLVIGRIQILHLTLSIPCIMLQVFSLGRGDIADKLETSR